jgi:hypothetical protein
MRNDTLRSASIQKRGVIDACLLKILCKFHDGRRSKMRRACFLLLNEDLPWAVARELCAIGAG